MTNRAARLDTTDWEPLYNRQHCLAIIFNMEKARGTTWRFGILCHLEDLGICDRMLKCLIFHLTAPLKYLGKEGASEYARTRTQ